MNVCRVGVILQRARPTLVGPYYDYLGIELLCRVDVSIIDNSHGGLDYFVNEIERGGTMVIFPNEWPERWIDRLADNLAIELAEWITHVTNK